jgi:hypothetical protein
MFRHLLNAAQLILDAMPLDTDIDPLAKERMMGLLRRDFAAELLRIRDLPDDADVSSLAEVRECPVLHFGAVTLLEQIAVARRWKRDLDSGLITSPLSDDAPFFVNLTLNNLPFLQGVLGGEMKLNIILQSLTSKPARLLLPMAAGRILSLLGIVNATPEQRELVKSALPVILGIMEKMKLTSSANQESIRKYVRLIDLILQAVNSAEEPNPKKFAVDLLEALSDLTEDLAAHSDLLIVGFKGIATNY